MKSSTFAFLGLPTAYQYHPFHELAKMHRRTVEISETRNQTKGKNTPTPSRPKNAAVAE